MQLTINAAALRSVYHDGWKHIFNADDPQVGEAWVISYAGGQQPCAVVGFSHQFIFDHKWFWIVSILVGDSSMLVLRERSDFIERIGTIE